MFVKIIPIIRLPRKLNFFDYLIPKKLENKIKINQIIEIPFRNQKIKGIIIEILSKTELFNKAKQFIIEAKKNL